MQCRPRVPLPVPGTLSRHDCGNVSRRNARGQWDIGQEPGSLAYSKFRTPRPRRRWICTSVVVAEREHDASDLVAAVDPAMRFDDLREWQDRIDDRLQHSLLGQRHEGSVVVGGLVEESFAPALIVAFCRDAASICQRSPTTIRKRPPGFSEPLTRA